MESRLALLTHILGRYQRGIDAGNIELFAQLAETRKQLDQMCDLICGAWAHWEQDRQNRALASSHAASDSGSKRSDDGQEDLGAIRESHVRAMAMQSNSEPDLALMSSSKPGSSGPCEEPASPKKTLGIRPGQFGGNPVDPKPGAPLMRDPNVRFKCSNAMVNKEYRCRVEVESMRPLAIVRIEGLEALGLAFNRESQSIEGIPSQAGEFSPQVVYCFAQRLGHELSQKLPFVVNHDPKSLWKNLPSDPEAPYWKTDEVAQGLIGKDHWLLAGASKRGRSHANRGACRDDDFMLLAEPVTGWHVLAVADGAGSASCSREGARLAARNASQALLSQLAEHSEKLSRIPPFLREQSCEESDPEIQALVYSMFSQSVYEAVKAIHAEAQGQQRAFSDFYTTLLLAAHKQIGARQCVLAYWIGDGGLAVYEAGQRVTLLGESDSGEFAGQTRFLDPMAYQKENLTARVRFGCFDSMTALVLMSDGITDPCFDTDHRLRNLHDWDRFWNDVLHEKLDGDAQKSAKRLLVWMDFWSPGNHDDRTLAMLYRSEVQA